MNVLDRLLNVIAPYNCVDCGREGFALCPECAEASLPLMPAGICYLCGKLSANFKTCAKCATKFTPEHVYIVAKYEATAKKLITAYKFNHMRGAVDVLAQYIDTTLPYFADEPLLVQVPTVPAHIRERGFDHATMLAKALARARGWHYGAYLVRQQNAQQHGASRLVRQQQVKGAFRVRSDVEVRGKHVLLLDDITTTGATLSECAKVLKKAGAARVDAVVFARTPEMP